MALTVIRAGMLTTVQDLGRRGHRADGVPLGGAVDAFALRLVNLLVGNAEEAAGLEFTLVGPELDCSHNARRSTRRRLGAPHKLGTLRSCGPTRFKRPTLWRWGLADRSVDKAKQIAGCPKRVLVTRGNWR